MRSLSTEHLRGQDTVELDLWYPGTEGLPTKVVIDLISVRASDGLRVSFDMGRNGWKVDQPVGEWTEHGELLFRGWREVGFFEAYAFQSEKPESK